MKKYELDLLVASNDFINSTHFLLVLRPIDPQTPLPEMEPGQFVQVKVENSPATVLRRPISINFVDRNRNELWLLVQARGEGTNMLANLKPGDVLNLILPLGRGFTAPEENEKMLLVGGGVGVAPMLYLGYQMKQRGIEPVFLLGARTADALLELDKFRGIGRVLVTTEDGSLGETGFVTQHSALETEKFDRIAVCGPKPMMVAVAKYAKQKQIPCEVSLENMMACGLGACLCCVEKTVKGNVCVCKEGPVFNIQDLTWQI